MSSQAGRRSLLESLAHYICPCFGYKQQPMQKEDPQHQHTTESHEAISQDQTRFLNLVSETVEVKPAKHAQQQQQQRETQTNKLRQSPIIVKLKEEDSESIDYDEIADMQHQYQRFMQKHILITHARQPKPAKLFQVEKYSQNKLIVIGSQAGRLLAKIKKIQIQPSSTSINLQKSAKNHSKQEHCNDPTIEKFWEKRYILFQNFDEGIKLDTQSWYSVTPQAVAEHVASKITGFDCVLDAFAGAGGDSIQLSLTNKQVISNDIDPVKVGLLINNAAVYGVDNILTQSLDFFQLEFPKGQVGAVYMSPPWGGIDYYEAQTIKPQEMCPSLQDIVLKSLSISENMGLLLPANMDIQLLIKELSCCAQKLNVLSTCSLLIEKIYFQDRLKFLLVLFGNKLTRISLSDQLEYIYSLLSQGKAHFAHKRVLKKLREDMGLIKLLNLVLQCQRKTHTPNQKQLRLYDAFINTLLQKQLISLQKLQKLNQMDELDEDYRSKNTLKRQKMKAKNDQALQASNTHKLDQESKQAKGVRMTIINSSGLEQTVSYVSQMSQSKLAATGPNCSLLHPDPESIKQLKNTINIANLQEM